MPMIGNAHILYVMKPCNATKILENLSKIKSLMFEERYVHNFSRLDVPKNCAMQKSISKFSSFQWTLLTARSDCFDCIYIYIPLLLRLCIYFPSYCLSTLLTTCHSIWLANFFYYLNKVLLFSLLWDHRTGEHISVIWAETVGHVQSIKKIAKKNLFCQVINADE